MIAACSNEPIELAIVRENIKRPRGNDRGPGQCVAITELSELIVQAGTYDIAAKLDAAGRCVRKSGNTRREE
jgi:hypothetical protein